MKVMKGKKKFLLALVALLVVGITLAVTLIHDSTDVVATQAVFDGITEKYTSSKNQVRILEIVPTSTLHTARVENSDLRIDEASELGYFMTLNGTNYANSNTGNSNASPQEPITATRGGVHGVPLETNQWGGITVNKTSDAFKETLMRFYEYGIIKPAGVDGGYYTKIGEYPIYAHTAVFSQFNNGLFTQALGSRLVNGYYVPNPNGTGKYSMDDNVYGINVGDQNKIYDVSVSRNDLGEIVSVSYNSITEVDTASVSLPKKPDGTPIITYNPDGTGNLDFVDVEGVAVPFQLYKGYSVANGALGNVYYSVSDQTKYHSSDWWNEYVLGDLNIYEDANLNTPYDVKAANTVTAADIDNYDLIYISGKYEDFMGDKDLPADVVTKIYNDEINYKHKAVMMDYATYNEELGTNVSKLALLLWQKSQMATYKDTAEEHPKWFNKATVNDNGRDYDVYNLNADAAWADAAFIPYLKENMVPAGTGNGNFVTGNTYVYNHHMSDFTSPKSMVDALDNFANGDFTTPYNGAIVSSGLAAVSKYIETSNANAITKMVSNSISPAVCIQYILVSTGADLDAMKLTLNVLEIEPVPAYKYNTSRGSKDYAELNPANADENRVIENRKAFVDDYLSSFYSDRIMFIHFTSMTINEFNTRNEDLVENYDIIYIGDETTRGNNNYYFASATDVTTKEWNDEKECYENKTTKDFPSYIDNNLKGNIYYNIGDIQKVFRQRSGGGTYEGMYGWLDGQPHENVLNADNFNLRYAGRDFTANKLTKLKEFLNSNALVLVGENLLGTVIADGTAVMDRTKNTVINPTITAQDPYGRVDNSSNVYAFLAYGLGKEYIVNNTAADAKDDPLRGSYENSENLTAFNNMVAVSDLKQDLVNREDLAEYVSTAKLALNITKKPAEYSYSADANGVITEQTYLDVSEGRYLEYEFSIVTDSQEASERGFGVQLYVDVNKDGKFSKTTENVQDMVITVGGSNTEAPRNEDNSYRLDANTGYVLRRAIADSYSGLLNWKLDVKSNQITHLHASETGFTLVKDPTDQKKIVKILQITSNGGSNLDLEARLYNERVGIDDADRKNWGIYLDDVPDYQVYIRTMTVDQYQNAFNAAYADYSAQIDQENGELLAQGLPTKAKLSSREYAEKATKYFFKEFVVQNVDIEDCDETPIDHTTPGATPVNVKGDRLADMGGNQIGVDMIVFGFGDAISPFTDADALCAFETFINEGYPVLTAHDTMHYRLNKMQVRRLRNAFGLDMYGVSQDIVTTPDKVTAGTKIETVNTWNLESVTRTNAGTNYLHSATAYNRNADANIFKLIEASGRAVAYQPNSNRNTTVPETQGLTNTVMEHSKDNRNAFIPGTQTRTAWINAAAANNPGRDWANPNQPDQHPYTVERINEGQITTYPYYIPASFTVSQTHAQWFSLDIDSDKDNDDETDVVVWYALSDNGQTAEGSNPFSDSVGGSLDPARGYYIYNCGNITYTGAGHGPSLTSAPASEVQLFVNTLLAAYQTGVSSPSAGFFETTDVNAKPITSIVVPYDGNVTNPQLNNNYTSVDSSIIKDRNSTEYKYKFVDANKANISLADGTVAYYRVDDANFVRGNREIAVKYYLQVSSSTPADEDGKRYYKLPGKTTADEVIPLKINDETNVSVVDVSEYIDTYPVKNYVLDTQKAIDYKIYMRESEEILTSELKEYLGIDPGATYGIYLPMDMLNENAAFTLILEARTRITTVSTSGKMNSSYTDPVYKTLTVTKADLLDLD